MLPVAMARSSSDGNTIRYVLPILLDDDIHVCLSINNGPYACALLIGSILKATHQKQNLWLCVMYAIALLGFYSAMKEV